MTKPVQKGMILAAGLGTRLLPISEKLPKPLVPVLNTPNILYSIALLKRSGIHDIILNIHHLPQLIENYLGDGRKWGVKLSYSEEATLLGTGGGVKNVERFFEGQTFVVVNCDFVTNLNLAPIIAWHEQKRSLATMILIHNPSLQSIYSTVGTDGEGHLSSLPACETRNPARTGIFSGIHILEPETLTLLPTTHCGINEVLYPNLMKNEPRRVFGYFADNVTWLDTGDIPAFWSSCMRLLEHLHASSDIARFLTEYGGYEEKRPGLWLPNNGEVPSHVTISAPVVVGYNCSFGQKVELGPYTLLGDSNTIGTEVSLSRFVSMADSQVADRRSIEGAFLYHDRLLPLTKPSKRG